MQLATHTCLARAVCICGLQQAVCASATLHTAHVALDEGEQVCCGHERQCVMPMYSTKKVPCCRDALALLRRQHGLEASPRKKNHRHSDLKAQDVPALEQVGIAEFLRHLLQSQAENSMQIIVGVLLFTPLLFLLPTTTVYYVLALLLHTAVLVTCWGLEILVQLGQTIPLYTLWCWAMRPGILPGELASWYMLCLFKSDSEDQLCSSTLQQMNVVIQLQAK